MTVTRILVLVVVLVSLLAVSYVNTSACDDECPKRNVLDTAPWAIQFRILDGFTLSSFDGGSISLKKHWSNVTAVRLGLELNVDHRNVSDERYSGGEIKLTDIDIDRQFIRIECQYMRYSKRNTPVYVYWGVGPTVSYLCNDSDRISEDGANTTITDKRYGVGLSGFIGVECFITRNLSVHAEYGYKGEYSWLQKSANSSEGYKVTDEIDQIEFEDRGVWLGVTAYL